MLARPPKKESQDLPPLGDRKNHEIAEEALSLILDSAAEGIFGCDPHGTFCNPAAIRMLGYSDSPNCSDGTCMRLSTTRARMELRFLSRSVLFI